MARPLRVEFENAWYHITNHGAARQAIFLNRDHYEMFLEVLAEMELRFGVEIHAYCLMPTHYHLMIKTPRANLSQAMRHLNSVYTQRFNLKTHRDGALFRGRFKSIVIDPDEYLAKLSRYIHLNPVKADLVKHGERYLWSSYSYYLNPKNQPGWLQTDTVLDGFGKRNARKHYQEFIEDGIDHKTEQFYEGERQVPILGSDEFKKMIREQYIKRKIDDEVHQQKHTLKLDLPTVDDVFSLVADHFKVPISDVKLRRGQHNSDARKIATYLAVNHTQTSLRDIANYMGKIKYPAVSKLTTQVQQELTENPKLAKAVKQITKKLG